MKASALVKLVEEMIKKHGDLEIWVSSDDYPRGLSDVNHRTEPDDGYYPTNVFVLE